MLITVPMSVFFVQRTRRDRSESNGKRRYENY